MSSFTITKAKVVSTKNGERLVLESGDDNLKIWMPSTHKDASKLVAGVTVEYETTEKGFHNYKSIIAAAPTPATPQAPALPAKEPVTLEQVTQTWVKIYQHLADTLPDQDEKSRRKSATTVFIAACQAQAYWKE